MSREQAHSVLVGPLTLELRTSQRNAIAVSSALGGENCYHLLFNDGVPRALPGLARRILGTGESALLDERTYQRFALAQSSGLMHWYLPTEWLRDRVADPDRLVGRPIRTPSNWGAALNALLAQLSPASIASGSVAPSVLAEQIGTLLVLIAEDDELGQPQAKRTDDLRDHVWTRIIEQCGNPALCVTDVARSLGVSARTLHRSLASKGETFAGLLIQSRIQLAERMLRSPGLWSVPISEIAKRAGFKDPSHFAKTFRRLRATSPGEARRQARDESS